jgi:hypothetical protein
LSLCSQRRFVHSVVLFTASSRVRSYSEDQRANRPVGQDDNPIPSALIATLLHHLGRLWAGTEGEHIPRIFHGSNRSVRASLRCLASWKISKDQHRCGIFPNQKGAAAPGGRGGRARTRSGDGEGWGRDRGRVAPSLVVQCLVFSVCCSARRCSGGESWTVVTE